MDKAVLEKYTRTYGTRFSQRQKERFAEALHQDFHALDYEPTMIEGKKLLPHAHNHLYRNMEQMKTVIIVPYDTPERRFWKEVLYFPFDGTKTVNRTMVATYVPISLFFALIFGGLYRLQPLITSTELASLVPCGLFLLTVMLMYWMIHSFHSARNCNRNPATVAAAVEIAKELNEDERKKVGFLFTDKNKMRFIGAEAAAKDLANAGKNSMLIHLDCIAKGNVVQIGFNLRDRKLANEIARYCPKKKSIDVIKPNEEMHTQDTVTYFKEAAIVSYGELDDTGNLCVIGTGTDKDRDIELETPDGSITMVKGYLHGQKWKGEGAA